MNEESGFGQKFSKWGIMRRDVTMKLRWVTSPTKYLPLPKEARIEEKVGRELNRPTYAPFRAVLSAHTRCVNPLCKKVLLFNYHKQ